MAKKSWPSLCMSAVLAGGSLLYATPLPGARAHSPAQQPSAGASTRQIGTVKEIKGNAMVLSTDAGAEVSVAVQETARVLRTDPGQTDLKTAAPIDLRDIQVGDRVLVRGKASEDGKGFVASMVVAIKKEAIEQKQAREREDWQKRGLGGLVKSVDPATRSITITTSALAGSKPVVVHLASETRLRRYASHSVRYDDAKPGTFEEIQPGDQFRGRGKRSADGSQFAAEEIITGSFRNIAGTVSAVDLAAKTLTVDDLLTKHPVVVRLTSQSSLHKLPETMAEDIAMRLSAGPPGGPPASAGGPPPRPPGPPQGFVPPGGPAAAGRNQGQIPGGPPPNGPQDLQQIVARLPAATLADFPKGEAVMIVASSANDSQEATAINLLGGVEPLLRASPEGSEQMMLSPWSLGGPAPEGGNQ